MVRVQGRFERGLSSILGCFGVGFERGLPADSRPNEIYFRGRLGLCFQRLAGIVVLHYKEVV